MPFVKIPGVDREVWIDLHEPQDTGMPWFVSAGTQVDLSPEQFAAEMVSPGGFACTETVVTVEPLAREALAARVCKAQGYESARRKLIKGHSGRPRKVFGFTKVQDFAFIVLYFESIGYKQAISRALTYWGGYGEKAPSRRHIDLALKIMREWFISDLFRAADTSRKQQNLPPISTKKPISRRARKN